MEFMKTMQNDSVDMTLTDIPYDGVNENKGHNKLRNIDKGVADEKTFELEDFLKQIDRITKGCIIVWCGVEQMPVIYRYFKNKGYPTRQLVWKKTNPSPMNGDKMYLSAVENAVWTKRGGALFNGKCVSNVFEYPTGSSEIHPTEKNHDLLRQLILENTKYEQVVFDPCAGSGSTLLVAGQEGRHYIGCELNKEFFEKADKRLKYQGGFQSKLFEDL